MAQAKSDGLQLLASWAATGDQVARTPPLPTEAGDGA